MTECTIHDAAQAFLQHLRDQGKKDRTLYTYARDLQVVEAFFGDERPLASIRTPQVGKFFKSDVLLKQPSGRERAERTVAKTIRVFRMLLVWAEATRRIELRPISSA